ncbi:MAG: hypothetical protein M3512_13135 [Bacteroidota bacterium]|nr:hypothetical protein [Bacteroidota bacterium]
MGVTRLKRKELRNRSKAKARQKKIKHLTAVPVIKNIDIEEIKKEFEAKSSSKKSAPIEEKSATKDGKGAEKALKAENTKEEPVRAETSKEEKAQEEGEQ